MVFLLVTAKLDFYLIKLNHKNKIYIRKESIRIIKTLFVLDFDGTYNNFEAQNFGYMPIVYLIPLNKASQVCKCAKRASKQFQYSKEKSIEHFFKEYLVKTGIEFQEIGYLPIPYGERQFDYLDSNILREIV